MITREELIGQLRRALALAESPNEEVVEFDIGDTDFTFELVDDDDDYDYDGQPDEAQELSLIHI